MERLRPAAALGVGLGEGRYRPIEDLPRTEVAGDGNRVAGASVRLRQGPAAQTSVGGHGVRLHRVDDRRPFRIPQLAHVEIALHAVQARLGWISQPALGYICRRLSVPPAEAYGVATFYALRRFMATNFPRLIPFDRERAQLESLDEALGELAAGRSVLMFPEGTRSTDGAIHDFKSGAGYLALRSGCAVLPIHIGGTYHVLGKGSLVPRHHPVEVKIGRVISADELRTVAEDAEGMGAYRKVAAYMRDAVIALAERRPAPAGKAAAR